MGRQLIHFDTQRSTQCRPFDTIPTQDTEHGPGGVKEMSQVVRSWGEHKAKHDVGGSDTVTERTMMDIKRIFKIREDLEPLFPHAASSLLDGGEYWEDG
jgi:hypothetical protein